jgi:hypothetical protein
MDETAFVLRVVKTISLKSLLHCLIPPVLCTELPQSPNRTGDNWHWPFLLLLAPSPLSQFIFSVQVQPSNQPYSVSPLSSENKLEAESMMGFSKWLNSRSYYTQIHTRKDRERENTNRNSVASSRNIILNKAKFRFEVEKPHLGFMMNTELVWVKLLSSSRWKLDSEMKCQQRPPGQSWIHWDGRNSRWNVENCQ